MTTRQIRLVQDSFETIKPTAGQAGLLFYQRLFHVDPSLRGMFRASVDEQAHKLMQILGVAVSALNRIEQLIPVLREMGTRHTAYGVRDEHYDTVGACLLWTLEQGLGAAFTEEVKEAWTAAFHLLAGVMKGAPLAAAQPA